LGGYSGWCRRRKRVALKKSAKCPETLCDPL
jgi:hypothetical protein